MGPAANAAVSTKWRDRMSRWRRSGLSIGRVLPPGADIAALVLRLAKAVGGRPCCRESGADGSLRAARARGRGSSSCRHLLGRRHRAFRISLPGGAIVTLPPQAAAELVTTAIRGGDVRRHGGRSPVLNVPTPVRVFLYTASTDMRKSFSGLHGLIVESLKQDPLSGDSVRVREPSPGSDQRSCCGRETDSSFFTSSFKAGHSRFLARRRFAHAHGTATDVDFGGRRPLPDATAEALPRAPVDARRCAGRHAKRLTFRFS